VSAKSRHVDPDRLRALRAAGQLLHRPDRARHPADVARAICGAQAQDEHAGRLAFRSRSARVRAADVDRARLEERAVLRTWAMRGTMHVLATEDWPWLVPLFEAPLAENSRRRLRQLGIDAAAQRRGLREIERALLRDGPLPRGELVERLARKGVVLDPGTRFHLFRLATALGVICEGPAVGAQTAVVLTREWLGERPAHDRDAALAELARRYLRAFGPATEADFAGWSGLGLRDVRSGLAAVAGETTEVRIGDERAWMPKRPRRTPRRPIVRLLPAWDTYLMGHRDRGFIAEPDRWRLIMPGGGVLRATIVCDGVAIGTWRLRRSGGAVQVALDPFADLDANTMRAIDAEIADVGRFEGMPVAIAGW
jgi:hypothetical protein